MGAGGLQGVLGVSPPAPDGGDARYFRAERSAPKLM
jgi:hypothetical protein